MTEIILFVVGFLLGFAGAKILPYIQDCKITKEEQGIIQNVVLDVLKDLMGLAAAYKNKQELVVAITKIVVGKLDQLKILGCQDEVEDMVKNVVDKFEEFLLSEQNGTKDDP